LLCSCANKPEGGPLPVNVPTVSIRFFLQAGQGLDVSDSSGIETGRTTIPSASYRSNIYSLPLGTYTGSGCLVAVRRENDELIISNPQGNQEICQIKTQLKNNALWIRNNKSDSIAKNLKSQA